MKELYDDVCLKTSVITTHAYSTSFSLGIRSLHKGLRKPICAIYGFVRFADEIVDTFHESNQRELLERFREDTYRAIDEKISLNPILHSFQLAVNQYNIELELIDTFLDSMEMDLNKNEYHKEQDLKQYILGSAEVVGLMCLRVFLSGDEREYQKLKPYAMALGSAFQKVNFLRDLRDDYQDLGRTYFPGFSWETFDHGTKTQIEEDIAKDFEQARIGITLLPQSSKFGVYLAYNYYFKLFKKIKRNSAHSVKSQRIRIPNPQKALILCTSYLRHRLNIHL